MLVREFLTKLNSLVKYALRVTSLKKDKLDVFIGRIRSNIAKDMIMRDNHPRIFSEAFDQAFRFKAIR